VPLTIIGIRSKSAAAAPLAFFMRTSFEASFSGKKSMDDFSKGPTGLVPDPSAANNYRNTIKKHRCCAACFFYARKL
jgi:hypothetical protein